ncbi:MAG: NADH-quinone oxidoreductase subunit NuoH [Gemmatimonadetes bacterium]|nr:NADH-quinone oxidoreductase subunit NuoH [Gemmatimonadota bacterium]
MELHPISGIPGAIAMVAKVLAIFVGVLLVVAFTTLGERKVAAWIQDRSGPNRVGPWGLLQPIADGLKNLMKEETLPAKSSKVYFILGPMISLFPAFVIFAVIPIAAPLPTPWGVVDMMIADLPIGILFILALSSLGVYGLVIGGWSSNNKYALLGGMRASAQMVSYEVAMGLAVVAILMAAGNVTLTQVIWQQQQLGMWFAFPLSLAFILFITSAFAETNRLPFDMPESESELVGGFHTEYSGMKYAMYPMAEYAHMTTASALMATLFFGGWDLPGAWDNAFWHDGQLIQSCTFAVGVAAQCVPGTEVLAAPAVWKTALTFAGFFAKVVFFLLVYVWVRWTVPRFRYDQVMALGWKVLLPTALGYTMLLAVSILVLDSLGMTWGFLYGLVLTVVSGVATGAFLFFLDRGRTISGAAAVESQKMEIKTIPAGLAAGD